MITTKKVTSAKEKQRELLSLFAELREILQVYEKYFSVRIDRHERYELWAERPVIISGRKRKEIFFSSIIVQSRYVGFYFMPLYADQQLSEFFGKELLSKLKGKSCFHLEERNRQLLQQVKEALSAGLKLYKARGWTERN